MINIFERVLKFKYFIIKDYFLEILLNLNDNDNII